MSEYFLKALRWLIDKIGVATLLSLVLIFIALRSLAVGVIEATRELDEVLALTVITVSLLLGWGLGKLPVRGWLAGLTLAAA